MQRREALKTGLVTLSALGSGAMGYAASVGASGLTPTAEASALSRKLAAALRATGNHGCIAAATRLEATMPGADVVLHLRGVGLTASAAERIAEALGSSTHEEASSLTSLSLSYNDAIGDAGGIAMAHAMPRSLHELGLVGCRITDAGGAVLVDWARRATRLRMLCVEGNEFSDAIRARFRGLVRVHPGLSVYV